jgi:type II secretory pathway pseudopilin PulG
MYNLQFISHGLMGLWPTIYKTHKKILHSKNGQSLLELVVLIGVIIVVVTGMVTTIMFGLKNSQLSQNQLQATKLAQEGLELMRTARQRNCPVTAVIAGSTHIYHWRPQTTQQSIWNAPGGESAAWPNLFFRINLSTPCGVTSSTAAESFNSGLFARKINLTDLSPGMPNQIRVSSTVEWVDSTGPHSSVLSTILANIDI